MWDYYMRHDRDGLRRRMMATGNGRTRRPGRPSVIVQHKRAESRRVTVTTSDLPLAQYAAEYWNTHALLGMYRYGSRTGWNVCLTQPSHTLQRGFGFYWDSVPASTMRPKKSESVPPILRHKSPICNLAEHLIAERPACHARGRVRDPGACCSRRRKCPNLGTTTRTWRGYG
jgi:hypothetical protein